MLIGLQGAGKTTTAGKLALNLKGKGKSPLLVAADVYRPAAIDQLEVLGETVGVPVFRAPDGTDPEEIARLGLERAKKEESGSRDHRYRWSTARRRRADG